MAEDEIPSNDNSEFSGKELASQLQQPEGKGLGFFARRKAKRLIENSKAAAEADRAASDKMQAGKAKLIQEHGEFVGVAKKDLSDAINARYESAEADQAGERFYNSKQAEHVNDALRDARKAGKEINLGLDSPDDK